MRSFLSVSRCVCTSLLCLLWFAGFNASAQAESFDEALRQIEKALNNADSRGLESLLHSEVEITINEEENTYPKRQAVFVLREFFMNYPVRSFRVMHKGNSASTWYVMGAYNSTRGKMDANIFVKKVGSKYVIQQIRFEKET